MDGEGRITRGISLQPSERDALDWLAEKLTGGNASKLIIRLIRSELARYADDPTAPRLDPERRKVRT